MESLSIESYERLVRATKFQEFLISIKLKPHLTLTRIHHQDEYIKIGIPDRLRRPETNRKHQVVSLQLGVKLCTQLSLSVRV